MLTGPAVCCGYLEDWETPKGYLSLLGPGAAHTGEPQPPATVCLSTSAFAKLLLRFGVFPEDKPPR